MKKRIAKKIISTTGSYMNWDILLSLLCKSYYKNYKIKNN